MEEARAAGRPVGFVDMMANAPKIDFSTFLPKFDVGSTFLPKFDVGSTFLPDNTKWINQLARPYGYATDDEPEPEPEPLTEEQINEKVVAFRSEFQARWGACRDYLAATAFPGLMFRLRNVGPFLSKPQVNFTFHGARGVDYENNESFDWYKLQDPSWEPANDNRWIPAARVVAPVRGAGDPYPIKCEHNDDGDLVVKVTLPDLRPNEVWRSDDDDVVLVLRDSTLDSVQVTYTVTAYEHDDVFVGEPKIMSVEKIDMFDAIDAALKASQKAE